MIDWRQMRWLFLGRIKLRWRRRMVSMLARLVANLRAPLLVHSPNCIWTRYMGSVTWGRWSAQ